MVPNNRQEVFFFMKILYRLGVLMLMLVGLSVFDYRQTPYQTVSPVNSVMSQLTQGTGNELKDGSRKAGSEQANNGTANNSKDNSGNIKNVSKDSTQGDSQSILKLQLAEYLSNPQQYYLLAVGNKGDNQHMIDTTIYNSPDGTSSVVGTLQYHCAVLVDTVTTQVEKIAESDWIKVELGSNKGSGYVRQNEAEIVPLQVKNPTNDVIRNRIIENSIKYIGLKFVRYGKSLSKGIDCSNFASQIYEQAGISIDTKPNGIKKQGVKVKESQALPGDIVYYYCNNGGGHVGIYMGKGFIINSAGHAGKEYPEGGVRICRVLYKDREKYEFIRII